ncbi:MAG: 5,10-methylenetetrahydrofolate reductase [Candidatus Fraserbacteria bacterium RBG_16_55_9]|uniref:Methylenetetrahydrofolate reductase n=1 Tax=Fraserbacteria sp. (strain RBG_16_55_9) TaxID=1817864 RepID=A0A1F5V2M6_FRAXR|nr:MAG: 5,10-methylenetetrahydrofolate reductase [Candidatus Fraserbacteria bacterium RBG_16_55_9]
MTGESNLKRILESAGFAVTAELGPPKGADRHVIENGAKLLGDWVDAINITDNQTAVTRMSSLSACAIVKSMGLDPVLQITARDRNALAIQSDILGASALGIRNVLCLTGDHISMGNHPKSKGVHDIDSIQMVQMVRKMRDEGVFLSGDRITGEKPAVFIGAAENPLAPPPEFRVVRLGKKANAGADFIQTQVIFDVERFRVFMAQVRERKLHEKLAILPGVMPVKSAKVMNYMNTKVPGVRVPDELIQRMQASPDAKAEGVTICVQLIQALKEIEGVRGVHIMAVQWEEVVPEIVERACVRKKQPVGKFA